MSINMRATRRLVVLAGAAALGSVLALAPAGRAAAQQFPSKPITLIVPYGPGGGTDLSARFLAAEMEKSLGQPVVVRNRAGGGGSVGLTELYRAAPDGYTIAVGTGSNTTIIPHTAAVAYDALKFSYIAGYYAWTYFWIVNPRLPVRTMADLVSYAKANPNALIMSTSGGFGIHDVAIALLAEKAGGFQYRKLPNNSAAETTTRMLAGDANLTLGSPATNMSHVRAGSLRALAVASDVSTPEMDAMGLENTQRTLGFSLINRTVVIAPPGVPEPIRARLEAAVKVATETQSVIDRALALGLIVKFMPGPAALAETREVSALYQRIIRGLLAGRR